jgi:Tfp pilus assembly protein PilP
MPASSQNPASSGPAGAPVIGAEQLNSQAERLRERAASSTLVESTRNPFRYQSQQTPRAVHVDPQVQMPIVQAPPLPSMRLSGVAQKGGKRSAIITVDGQLYGVGEGQTFGGRYTIIKVDPEVVLYRDADGVERRLALPQ